MSFEIIDREQELSIEIKMIVPSWKMPFVIGKTYKKLNDYLQRIDAEASGPPYIRYLNLDWQDLEKDNRISSFFKNLVKQWDLLIGFPVSSELEGEGEIVSSVFPEGRYLKTVHSGSYNKVSDTYMKMITWSKAHKFNLLDESAEIYLNDPRNTKKKDLRTVVLIPIND